MIKITETLHYDPITGNAWYTIQKNYSRILTAKDTSGYIHAWVGKRKYRLHRLVWEKINGPIPDGMQIDHIDCNKRNNALSNLRVVDRLTNMRNRKPPTNSSGYPGVKWSRQANRWTAKVRVSDKTVWRSCNRDARVLYNKYREAKTRFHGEDSIRHYPPPIDTSRFTVAPTKPYYVGPAGRGAVVCIAPKPHRSDYKWSVTHMGKRVFTTSNEAEAREFAVNLRKELDNKRASSTTQP